MTDTNFTQPPEWEEVDAASSDTRRYKKDGLPHFTANVRDLATQSVKRGIMTGVGGPSIQWLIDNGYLAALNRERASPMHLVSKHDPILKTVCEPFRLPPRESVRGDIVAGMFRIMRENRGVGLAAPQIGIAKRLIVVDYMATRCAIVDPVIVKRSARKVTSIGEGCLSFPGERVNVQRYKRVIVEGFSPDGEPVRIDARGMLAFILQHEIDHLDGVTIV